MTTLVPGINFPSVSATSTIRLAILSFTDPRRTYARLFPLSNERWSKKPEGHDPGIRDVRRLHFIPASFTTLLILMKDV